MSKMFTARQTEYLEHLATGIGDIQISRRMHISPSTAKHYREVVQERMPEDVETTRTGIAVWYTEWKYAALRDYASAVVQDPNPENLQMLAEALEEVSNA